MTFFRFELKLSVGFCIIKDKVNVNDEKRVVKIFSSISKLRTLPELRC